MTTEQDNRPYCQETFEVAGPDGRVMLVCNRRAHADTSAHWDGLALMAWLPAEGMAEDLAEPEQLPQAEPAPMAPVGGAPMAAGESARVLAAVGQVVRERGRNVVTYVALAWLRDGALTVATNAPSHARFIELLAEARRKYTTAVPGSAARPSAN